MLIRLDPAVKSIPPTWPWLQVEQSLRGTAAELKLPPDARVELDEHRARTALAGARQEELHAAIRLYKLRTDAGVRWRPHPQQLSW